MTTDHQIDQLVNDMDFERLVAWADKINVHHTVDQWFDDMWEREESELRVNVALAMRKVGNA